VLKSTDGGSTWNTTGLSFTPASYNMVNRLLLDPANNNTIVAATTAGVYKTTNGGTNWTLLSTNEFIDMEYKPGVFNTLYGSTSDGKIYISTNGGTTWTQALSVSNGQRTELAVSANQATWVYAVMANDESGLYGIYKSTNSGSSYTQIFAGTTKNLLGYESSGSDSGGQGWYDLCIATSPSNANTVLVGGVNTWRSTNGGTSWSIVNHWWGDGVPAVHADKHALVYRSNGDLFECNDGGVYLSTNNGTSWTDKTNGIVTSQMYKLGCSVTSQNVTITGLQDNGTKLLYNGTWYDVKGGDGTECLIDYGNVNIQYGAYVNGQIDRTTDMWSNATDISPNGNPDGAWVTPYVIDPVTPATIYVGYADLYKSTNRGDSWTQISNVNSSDRLQSIAIAPSNTQVIYIADNTRIWKTTNGGTSWSNITGTLPVSSAYIRYITVKNNDPSTVWVCMSGFTSPGVYQTTNGGTSWTNISTGLPTIPVNSLVQNKLNTTANELYCGTEYGVYFKNGSSNWVLFSNGLPKVKIGELEIWYGATSSTSKLRAASYGRGLWQSDLYSNETQSYVSSTVTQTLTSDVAPNTQNQQIVAVEITMNGDISPLSVTSFSFNTTGTTNPATDISNARLYYSGTSSLFEATNAFGTAVTSPSGNFSFTGAQTLSNGVNYFWLCYDINSGATLGNFVDAQCTSLTIGTAKTPTVTNPDGNRRIAITYCDAGSPDVTYEYISNVSYGTVANNSARGTAGYENFTPLSSQYLPGETLNFSVGVTNAYETDEIIIWVDWNNDGDFADTGEPMYASSGSGFTSPHTGSFAIPVAQAVGTYRMRIRLTDAGNGPNITPCGNSSYGEVEDYSIEVYSIGPVVSCSEQSIYEQVYDSPSQASLSDVPTGYLCATQYDVTGYVIESLDIWMVSMTNDGSNWLNCEEASPMSVNVVFYNDNAGTVGSAAFTFNNISATMLDANVDLFDSYPLYRMSITLPQSVNMPVGFVSVQGLAASGTDCWLMWINAPAGSGLGMQYASGAWTTSISPFTLCLHGSEYVPPPVAGTAVANSPICSGTNSSVSLSGYTGNIQWQKSTNGTSGWINVSGGSGATTSTYTTPNLTATTYYRVAVSQTGYTTVYSNVVSVVVNTVPGAAGSISGVASVCKGQSVETYSVADISNAESYIWTLPSGATGTSLTNSITVTFGALAVSGNITVKGHNTCGNGSVSTKAITVHNAPVVDLGDDITTCGEMVSMDAGPGFSSYVWNGTPYLQVLEVGVTGIYTVVVTDNNGCTATDDIYVEINEVPYFTMSATDESAQGASDGMAYVDVQYVVGPQILWSNGETTETITGLAAGLYCVTVTNQYECQWGQCVLVMYPGQEFPAFSVNPVMGCQPLQVQFTDLSSGSPTQWEWDFGDGITITDEQNPNHLYEAPGIYTVSLTVTYESGTFEAIQQDYIVVWDAPEISYDVINETEEGAADGSISLNITGGITPYEVLWSDNSTGMSLGNLSAGNYSVSVADAHGCTDEAQITVIVETLIAEGQSDHIEIFPNPASKTVNIAHPDACKYIVVTDINGKTLVTARAQGKLTKIDISSLAAGMYIVEVQSGNSVTMHKLIVD